jgi:transposase-like protein
MGVPIMFDWNYFEPREIGFSVKEVATACKLMDDGTLAYWVRDAEEGYRLLIVGEYLK